MRLSETDLQEGAVQRVPSPSVCIYCGDRQAKLNDEHVIPYALGAHSLILEKSCCRICQEVIQPYEQEVLDKQLGTFRDKVGSPSRSRKKRGVRKTELSFLELDGQGRVVRDLGKKTLDIDDMPLILNLWNPPPPQFTLRKNHEELGLGEPLCLPDKKAVEKLCKQVSEETGAKTVAVKLGEISRLSFLRFLAKTAHAYAAAEIGVDTFEPYLTDCILKRSNALERFVGGGAPTAPFSDDPAQTFQISLGSWEKSGKCIIGVRIGIFPMLGTPEYFIIVGEADAKRIDRLKTQIG